MEARKRSLIIKFLEQMKPGQQFALVEIDSSDIEGVREIVKEFIDSLPYGGFIEFNKDYTVVKRIYSIF